MPLSIGPTHSDMCDFTTSFTAIHNNIPKACISPTYTVPPEIDVECSVHDVSMDATIASDSMFSLDEAV